MAKNDGDKCALPGCGKSRLDHERTDVKHIFSEDGELTTKRPKVPEGPRALRGLGSPVASTDPLLRAILIDKGIITVDELEEKEKLLRHLGVVMAGGRPTAYRESGSGSSDD